ncbi:MAG: hypothetical protein ABR875_02055 [Minisyncoccia bacterium]
MSFMSGFLTLDIREPEQGTLSGIEMQPTCDCDDIACDTNCDCQDCDYNCEECDCDKSD